MVEASSFHCLLVNFSSMFTEPSFKNFMSLVCGWAICAGRRTISRVIQLGDFGEERRHHSIFYRFFSRAVWLPNELGRRVCKLAVELLPEGSTIVLTVDDTLCRKSGAHIWGGGMHHDPLLSNYGRGKSLVKFFSFGHNWVIVCICIPTPWNRNRAMAVPVAFRLYRSKKRCPKEQYRKRTELAREMIEEINTWLPEHRAVILVGDTEYACREVVRGLPKRIEFVGPMSMDAALFEPPPEEKAEGRGRPRKKGRRLLSPRQLIAAEHTPWEPHEMLLYGKTVTVLIKTQLCLWYTVSGSRFVRMIVTRDPNGRIEDRAYFSTDAKMSVQKIAQVFSMRWTQEEMHRNVKQYLGLEDPQNGWWRGPNGERRDKRVPGPMPHKERGEKAVLHTVPFVLTIYALVILWYFQNGSPKEDVARARRRAPWYREKVEPSFGDMFAAVRRHLWAERNFSEPIAELGAAKLNPTLLDWLSAA
jgi:hypothetical protein